jgi:hypothetical protein
MITAPAELIRGDLWDEIGSFTAIVPLPADRDSLARVQIELAKVECAVHRRTSALARVPGLHVARLVVLPERVRGHGLPVTPTLVLWTVFDGARGDHLYALATKARSILDAVLSPVCPGYPPPGAAPDAVVAFLERHEAQGRAASYFGTTGMSVETIRRQRELFDALAPKVRELRRQGLSNEHTFLKAREFARSGIPDPTLRAFAARRPATAKPPPFWRALLRLPETKAALFGLGLLLVVAWCELGVSLNPCSLLRFLLGLVGVGVAALVAFALVWFCALRRAEERERREFVPAPYHVFERHDEMLKRRDNEGGGLNRVTIVTDVKPGWVRQLTLRAVLWLTDLRARRVLDGVLQGIETIHFAQWRLVDGGRRMVFMSNYDGGPLDYFREFGENAAPGVNAIWSNTDGMPSTSMLINEGARDLETFQRAARMHQIPTDVWFHGYPDRDYTIARINECWEVHRMLHDFPTPSEVAWWVAVLEG